VQRQVKYVAPVPDASATGLVAQVYAQVTDDMRLVIPPALLHSPAPDVLAAYWVLLRESLVAGRVDRAVKEAAAAAVSVANICPYCVDVHSVGLYDLSTEHDAEAVAADRVDEMGDADLRSVAAWARMAHQVDAGAAPPADLTAAARAELIGVVVCFHYLTRMVNVFLSSFLLPPGLGPGRRRRLKQGISRLLRSTLRGTREPGRSLDLLPAAPLPASADWAAGSPDVAAAAARSYRVFELAGRRSLPTSVRQLVLEQLERWRGEETGLSTAWCEDLIVDLSEPDRSAARLALLTALASHQVGEDIVAEFQRHHEGDGALVDVTAWASFSAARLIGSRQSATPGRRLAG